MKRISFFLCIFFTQPFWVSIAISQTSGNNYLAVVGDTLLLKYGRIERDNNCGPVQYVGFSPIDSINFLAKWEFVNGGVNYWIYFMPHEAKKYDKKIHLSWVYPTKQGCNYPTPGEDFSFTCFGISDTIFHLTQNVIDDDLKIDTDKVVRYDLIRIPFRNKSGELVIIDSVRYGGSEEGIYTVNLDSDSYPKGFVNIPASVNSDSLKVSFVTKTPPDLKFSTIPITIYGKINSMSFVDTVYLRIRSSLLTVSLMPSENQIRFLLPPGGHVDTSIIITYSKFLRFLDVIGATNGFETLSVKDAPPTTTLVLRCSTSDSTFQNRNVALDFSYEEDFNLYSLGYNHAMVYVSYEFVKSKVESAVNINDELSLFPNPSSGDIILSCPNPSKDEIQWLKIISETGSIVFSTEEAMKSSNSLPFRINTSTYSKGIYMLIISKNGRLCRKKFILQ